MTSGGSARVEANATSPQLLWALQFRRRPSTHALLAQTRAALAALEEGSLPAAEEAVAQLGALLEGLGAEGRERVAAAKARRRAAEHAEREADERHWILGVSAAATPKVAEAAEAEEEGVAAEGEAQAAASVDGCASEQSGAGGGAKAAAVGSGDSFARLLLAAVAASDLDLSDPQALGEGWLELEDAAAALSASDSAGDSGGAEGAAAASSTEGQAGQALVRDLAWLRARQAQWEEKGCVKDALLSPLYR